MFPHSLIDRRQSNEWTGNGEIFLNQLYMLCFTNAHNFTLNIFQDLYSHILFYRNQLSIFKTVYKAPLGYNTAKTALTLLFFFIIEISLLILSKTEVAKCYKKIQRLFFKSLE
jgi:hypothetical protein